MTDEFLGSVRLGGKKEPPDHSLSILRGRVVFLETARIVVPKVLLTFRADVLRLYPIEDWITDIKQRVRITQVKTEQDKLDRMEAQLKSLTSPEQQRAMALSELENELK